QVGRPRATARRWSKRSSGRRAQKNRKTPRAGANYHNSSKRAHRVMMVGSIEAALGGAFAGKCRSDQHQGGPGDARFLRLGAASPRNSPASASRAGRVTNTKTHHVTFARYGF